MSASTGFIEEAASPVPALRLTLRTWRHSGGAVHHHLANSDQHRGFCVAFRTPPGADHGVAHILEHTALCGSRRFPVRDPFFKMLRRSLQTFMNAMTGPDCTFYPFASQGVRDFDNLLEVYLDAVFRPLLDVLDFAQEGHRLEPLDVEHGWQAQRWRRTGVVFNEMKGALDSTEAQVGVALARALMPATCYRWDSGGAPEAIPQLSHGQLLGFHRRCYHPANACFVTYGDLDIAALHARLAPYLTGTASEPALPPPVLQAALATVPRLSVPVPLAAGQTPEDVAAATLCWVWGDTADLDEALLGELFDRLLLGHAGAPLRLALETSGLGRSIGGSGYAAAWRNGTFTIELDGIKPVDQPRFAPLVLGVLAEICASGFPADEVAAALHQVELARREIAGDHYPFGIELCVRVAGAWNLGVDPLPVLDQTPAIERLRQRALTPGFLADELRRRTLDHAHRAEAWGVPDPAFHTRAEAAENAQVERDLERLERIGRERLVHTAKALAVRQAQVENVAVLPDLALSDVPARRQWAQGEERGALSIFTPTTNGILHQLVAIPLPTVADEDLDLLPLLASCIGQLGAGDHDYAAQSARLNACCSGVQGWLEAVADPDDARTLRAFLLVEVKGLDTRHEEFTALLAGILADGRFDEHDRLAELIDQELQRAQDDVMGRGNSLAGRAALRGLGGAATLAHRFSGLGRLAWLKRTAASIAEDAIGADDALAALASRLAALSRRLATTPRRLAVVGDAAARAEVLAVARRQLIGDGPEPATRSLRPALAAPAACAVPATAFTTAAAVNHVALGFAAVPVGHGAAPALAVAAQYLTHHYLHPRLREQGGAYGASAAYQATSAALVLSSYRDPRLAATVSDLRAAGDWLAAISDDERPLRESILAAIAAIDTPASPAGEAKARFRAELRRAGPDRIDHLRSQVLAVTADDLRRVAGRFLVGQAGTAAAITSAPALAASGLGWVAEEI